eukprot:COSAG02_NODE_670_length_18676_cov_29.852029_4_plen_70_part_00
MPTASTALCNPLRWPWYVQEEEEQKRQSMLGALADLAAEKEKLTALLAEEQVHSPHCVLPSSARLFGHV